ncbi:hypothetical protein BKA61DRAFT_734057 [Leptodontidium sp. MPI-SDFR-AT-0119]|nr:hypothetical protein BKA61DRAFT_734057 [Leptodontidium sp. MPI-SDFR-AT-0119]
MVSSLTTEGVIGASPPPPGVTPNFNDPENTRHRLVITSSVFQLLSTTILLLRLYTRHFIVGFVGVEDYIIILAVLLSWGMFGTAILSLRYGIGTHLWDVPFTTFNPNFFMIMTVHGMFYGLATMLTKLSMLLFLRRLAPNPRIQKVIFVTMATVVVYCLLGSFEFLWRCQPIAKAWDISIIYGSCIDLMPTVIANGCANSATDLAILILPCFILADVRLPLRQKFGVGLLLAMGGFVFAISVVRLKLCADLNILADITWSAADASIFWAVELHVSIICACLTHAKPFFRYFVKRVGSSHSAGITYATSVTAEHANHLSQSRSVQLRTDDEEQLDQERIRGA